MHHFMHNIMTSEVKVISSIIDLNKDIILVKLLCIVD